MMTTDKLYWLIMITLPVLIISYRPPWRCPQGCTKILDRRCAVMGNETRTFDNPCLLQVQNRCYGGRWVAVSNCSCNFEGVIETPKPVWSPGPVRAPLPTTGPVPVIID